MKKCKNCKKENPKDAEICCEYCGEPFEETELEKFSKALSDPSKYKVLIPIPTPEEEKEKEINLLKQEVEIAKLKKKLEDENRKESKIIRFLKALLSLFKKKEKSEDEALTEELGESISIFPWTEVGKDADDGNDYPYIHQYEPKIWTSGDTYTHTWTSSSTSTSTHDHDGMNYTVV